MDTDRVNRATATIVGRCAKGLDARSCVYKHDEGALPVEVEGKGPWSRTAY